MPAIENFTPLLVKEGVTGDQYVPFPKAPTIKGKYQQIPPSQARYAMGKPFVWVDEKDYFKKHAHDGEPYAELADLLWQMFENRVEKKPRQGIPALVLEQSIAPSLLSLVAYKVQHSPSNTNHYALEVDEFIEAVNHYKQRHQQASLTQQQQEKITAICHQLSFGKKELAAIFQLIQLPPRSIKDLIQYLSVKMEGRVLMDRVFPGKTSEAGLLRKSRLYPFEQVYADFVFGSKTMGQKLTLGAQRVVWSIAKPFVAKMEHWQSPIAN